MIIFKDRLFYVFEGMGEVRYTVYNDPSEVAYLNQNVFGMTNNGLQPLRPQSVEPGAQGSGLYSSQPRQPAYYVCSPGRDLSTHYIFGVERNTHPDHSSRFGYARCKNGYCSGVWPGRYIEPDDCAMHDPQPEDMAPARFYTAPYQGPYNDLSQATLDYNYTKNYGMNYPVNLPGQP